jgi:hypothetical protein
MNRLRTLFLWTFLTRAHPPRLPLHIFRGYMFLPCKGGVYPNAEVFKGVRPSDGVAIQLQFALHTMAFAEREVYEFYSGLLGTLP